jgi:hypothetical protein
VEKIKKKSHKSSPTLSKNNEETPKKKKIDIIYGQKASSK